MRLGAFFFWLRQELSKLLCVSVRLYGRKLFRTINPHFSAQNLHDGFRIQDLRLN